jgi:membrane-associated phospholipid phosphatase
MIKEELMDALMQFEIAITLFFQNLGNWLSVPFTAITNLGNEFFYLIAMPAIYWCFDAALGFRLRFMLVFTTAINGYLKTLFHSPRPFWVDSRVHAYASETSFGLPSGHSQNAASLWGTFAASVKKRWVSIICLVIIFLIGLSRIYLGVHFTRDVLAGWLIGGLLVLIFFRFEKPVAKWIAARSFSVQIVLSLAVAGVTILFGLLITTLCQSRVLPQEWIQRSLAAINLAPDPYNLEGYFTISGVWFGFTAGYAWWIHKFGKMIVLENP